MFKKGMDRVKMERLFRDCHDQERNGDGLYDLVVPPVRHCIASSLSALIIKCGKF